MWLDHTSQGPPLPLQCALCPPVPTIPPSRGTKRHNEQDSYPKQEHRLHYCTSYHEMVGGQSHDSVTKRRYPLDIFCELSDLQRLTSKPCCEANDFFETPVLSIFSLFRQLHSSQVSKDLQILLVNRNVLCSKVCPASNQGGSVLPFLHLTSTEQQPHSSLGSSLSITSCSCSFISKDFSLLRLSSRQHQPD